MQNFQFIIYILHHYINLVGRERRNCYRKHLVCNKFDRVNLKLSKPYDQSMPNSSFQSRVNS